MRFSRLISILFPWVYLSVVGAFALKIKAVVFDLGSTLVKYDVGPHEEVFRRVLASLEVSRSVGEIKEAFLKGKRGWRS